MARVALNCHFRKPDFRAVFGANVMYNVEEQLNEGPPDQAS